MIDTGFSWSDGLEGPARNIAELDHTPIRVLAGPGTGKTFALMRRIARLIQSGAAPNRMLVCTFTRTAAKDLEGELARLGVSGASDVRAGTLHAFCFGLLGQDEVLEATDRVPRPILEFEERFLLEDLKSDFGGVRGCRKRLRAFEAAWARLQSRRQEDPMIRLIGPSKTNSSVGCGFTKPCSSENSSRNVSATYRRTQHRTTARHSNTSWLTSTRTSTGRNRRYWICLPNPEISSSSGRGSVHLLLQAGSPRRDCHVSPVASRNPR